MVEIKEQNIEKIERKGFGYNPIDYGIDTDEEFAENFLRTKFDDIQVTSSRDNIIFKFPKRLIKHLPSPESITRARRSLNSKGIGLPTDNSVFVRRMRRQQTIRKYFKEEKEVKWSRL